MKMAQRNHGEASASLVHRAYGVARYSENKLMAKETLENNS